jgi:hypothetical protein
MDTGAGTMTKKRGDDQYGYDPEHSTARSVLDHMEQQAEQRPDKPAKQIGDALKVPKITPTTKRLIDAHVEIVDGPGGDLDRPDGLPGRSGRDRRRRSGAVELPASGPEAAGQRAAPQPPDHRRDRDRNHRHLTLWDDCRATKSSTVT